MSVQAITWALSLTTGSPVKKAVLLAIANYADEWGVSWPSQEALAHDTEYSVRAVQKALGELEEAKILSRERRYGKNGYRTSDLITLDLHAPRSPEQRSPEQNSPAPQRKTYPHEVRSDIEPSSKEPSLSSGGKKTRIPPNFVLEEKVRARALDELGYRNVEVDDEMEFFREYFQSRAGPTALHVNWQTTAWKWLKRGKRYEQDRRSSPRPKQSSQGERLRGIAREVREFLEQPRGARNGTEDDPEPRGGFHDGEPAKASGVG